MPMIISPLVTSIVRDPVTNIINGFGFSSAPSIIQRDFTTFDSTTQNYIGLGSSVSPTRIVMDVYSPTGIATGLPTGAPTPTANQLTTLDFAYTGSIQDIGRNGASYFDGIIANVIFYNGAAVIGEYPIDEPLSGDVTVVKNSAAVLGSELWDFANAFTSGESTIDITNQTAHILSTTGEFSRVGDLTLLDITKTYLVEFEVYDFIEGLGSFTTNGSDVVISIEDNGFCSKVVNPVDTRAEFKRLSDGIPTNFKVRNISIREIPPETPYGTFFNGSASSSELFTFYEQGFWLGEDGTILELPESTTLFSSDDMLLESSDNIILEAANG